MSKNIRSYVKLIEMAHKYGVAKLEFGDLKLEFHPDYTQDGPKAHLDLPKALPPLKSPASDQKQHEIDQALLDDVRKTQLLLDDPLSFEQEMIDSYVRDQ